MTQEAKDYLRQEMDNCSECLRGRAQGFIPSTCQHHIDMQMEMKERGELE